jgi:hypothetical protein
VGIVAALLGEGMPAASQEALQLSLAGDAAAQARRAEVANQPYTIKTGDFKLLLSPAVTFAWNDNINVAQSALQSDFIISPTLGVAASHPLTPGNWFQLNASVGYDEYLKHSAYSGPRLLSGSALSFDFYTGDFWINFHDRSQYFQDSAGVSAVATNGFFGGFDNFVGPQVTWDLKDVILTLGYDHENFIASTSTFDYVNHSSELVVARAGLRLNRRLTTGVEGTVSYTSYDEKR